jgi:transcriptional regulator with GAF, ATPase, and Fis domain
MYFRHYDTPDKNMKVTWVTRTHYGLEGGIRIRHKWELQWKTPEDEWTVEEMQVIHDAIHGAEPPEPPKPPRKKLSHAQAFTETIKALDIAGWNRAKAAQILGITQSGLAGRFRRFRLSKP